MKKIIVNVIIEIIVRVIIALILIALYMYGMRLLYLHFAPKIPISGLWWKWICAAIISLTINIATKKQNCAVTTILFTITFLLDNILFIPICIPILILAQQFEDIGHTDTAPEQEVSTEEFPYDEVRKMALLQMTRIQAKRELEQFLTAMVAEYGFEKIPTSEEFAAVYRKEIKKAHPDNGGSEEEFVRVKKNLDVISTAIRTLESDGRPSEKDLDRIRKWHEEKQTG